MTAIAFYCRLTLLSLLISLPAVLLATALLGLKGILWVLPFGALVVVGMGFFARSWILKKIEGSTPADQSLTRSFEGAFYDLQERPEIFVYENPTPNLIIARGWRRPPILLLSRGLLQFLDEFELRALFVYCHAQSKARKLLILTLSAMAIDFFLKRAPQGWVKNFWGYTISNPERRRLGPISLMQFCGIYPWVIAVQWISGGRPEFGWGELSSIEFLQSKIETKGQSRSYDPIPSLELLYLCQPKMDLPFRLSSTHEACNSEPL